MTLLTSLARPVPVLTLDILPFQITHCLIPLAFSNAYTVTFVGPYHTAIGGFSYYILFINDFSCFITLFLMKSKNEAPSLFIEFQSAAEHFCNKEICIFRINNAPKLVCGQMQTHCKSQGIIYEKTVPDFPSQNGMAERTNLMICSMARAMLIDADLCDYFWPLLS